MVDMIIGRISRGDWWLLLFFNYCLLLVITSHYASADVTPPPLSVLVLLLFPWMGEWCRVIPGRLIYPRDPLGVDQISVIRVGSPGL